MQSIRKKLVLFMVFAVSGPAGAVDFQWGEGLQGTFKSQLTWGTQVRTEAASPEVYAETPSRVVPGLAKGLLQGQTGGSDLNFARGQPISTVLKGVWDLDLTNQQMGLFLSASAWHDKSLGEKNRPYGHYPNGFQPGQPLDDKGFAPSSKFSHAQWREAYVYADLKTDPDKALSVRFGRQVLQWGPSKLHTGGINAALNAQDFSSQWRPGATPEEGRQPWGLLHVKKAMGPEWRVEGFAAYESQRAVLPACGTYFDVNSFAPQGCDFASLGGVSEQSQLASGAYLRRQPDVKAKSSGQYGLALGRQWPSSGTDVQLFALNTHSTQPSLRMNVQAAVPGVRAVEYAIVYPENVTLWGVGWTQKWSANTRMRGEVAYRPNQPIAVNAFDVLSGFVTRSPTSVLALNKGIRAIPVGGSFDAYDRMGVLTGSWGMAMQLPKSLGADRVVWLGEVGLSQVQGLPDTALLRYGRPLAYNGAAYAGGPTCVDAVAGKTCTSDGYTTQRAWGVKMQVSATYVQALLGLTWTPSLWLSKDVKGYAHDGAYAQGRWAVRPTLRVAQGQKHFVEIQYNRFGGGQYNLLSDRDFVSLVAGTRF